MRGYIHDNAEDLGDIRSGLDRLYSWGFNVFVYDHRGYGTSDSKLNEVCGYYGKETRWWAIN